MPTALDHALAATTILVEAPHTGGPYGAKGLGEPAIAPTAAAIGNAIYDAIGIRLTHLPITAEKLRQAIRKDGGE